MRRYWPVLIVLLVLLAGCPRLPGLTTGEPPSLDGTARFQETYQTQATSGEIANGATVSLIDPGSGQTVVTTLTQPSGTFTLSFKGWTPQVNYPYLLEAVKGLSVGGAQNRVGAGGARLRTLVSFSGGSWSSITNNALQLSRSTTALCVIASLKGLSLPQVQALVGSVTVGASDTFGGTPQVSTGEFSSVWGLADTCLTLNQDPVRSIARDTTTGTYFRLEHGPVVTDASTLKAAIGATLILYGNGFDPVSANNLVKFNGTAATSVSVNAAGTQLSVVVPGGASTGYVTVQVGNLLSNTGLLFTVSGSTIRTYAGATSVPPATLATHWAVQSSSVAVDGSGRVYVASYLGNAVYQVNPTTGVLTMVAGTGIGGFNGDGIAATSAMLNGPAGIALDAAGNLYIADAYNYRVRKVAAATGLITTIAGTGANGYAGDGGPATAAVVARPNAVVVDPAGNLYFDDNGNAVIRRVDAGTGTITTVAGTGTNGWNGDNLSGPTAMLNNPQALALDAAGNLYIADWGNGRIRKLSAGTGLLTTVAGGGAGGDGVAATAASLSRPSGVCFDNTGSLVIADTNNNRVRRVDQSTGLLSTIAGTGTAGYAGDNGAATAALIAGPVSVAVDSAGNLYIANGNNFSNSGNNYVRKVAAGTGIITTLAGNGTILWSGDGASATNAQLYTPSGVALDAQGNLYIADTGNHCVRRVDAGTGAISTIAGSGTAGYAGDSGPALSAQLKAPNGVAVDAAGNVYVADTNNSSIRKVTPGGIISTVAGTGTPGYTGDSGLATSADLRTPMAVLVDGSGNLYISDTGNHCIRKVDAVTGVITTVAGTGTAGYGGDSGPAVSALLNAPRGLALDGAGNLYIADFSNCRIRRVDATSGLITTFAGTGVMGYSGNGGLATAANLNQPSSLGFDAAGNLFIADYYNYMVRQVAAGTGVITRVAGGAGTHAAGDGGSALSAAMSFPYGIAVTPQGQVYIATANDNLIRLVY